MALPRDAFIDDEIPPVTIAGTVPVAVQGTVPVSIAAAVTTNAPIERLDFGGTQYPVYVGKAAPGSATSSAVWSIAKYTYVGTSLSSITYAGGGAFNQVWDNRAGLTYA